MVENIIDSHRLCITLGLTPKLFEYSTTEDCFSPYAKQQKTDWNRGRSFPEEHKKRISESLKGKPKSKEHMIKMTVSATKKNTGKKRPEHSKLMKELCRSGKFRPPVGSHTSPHSQETKKKISLAAKNRVVVSCVFCHKPNESGTLSKGIWYCHYVNHHKDCVS